MCQEFIRVDLSGILKERERETEEKEKKKEMIRKDEIRTELVLLENKD